MAEQSTAKRRTARGEAPVAPWGSFPLAELTTLVGIVLLVTGFVIAGSRGAVMIGAGLALASLAGLELAIREHLAGYRSHTMVLAGLPALITLGGLFALAPEGFPPLARVAAGVAVFGLAAWGCTVLFRRRSGGLSYRITGFKR